MRKLKRICRSVMGVILLSSLFSCNQDTGNCPSAESEIPIFISSHSRIQTRAIENSFEEEDEIGLYVIEQPLTLSDERYVDNLSFRFQDNSWIGESKIYYPTLTGLCDFIAYYPYKSEGISASSSVYALKVEADQSSKESYSKSDFLIAGKKDVSPSIEPVPLIFKHKLVEVKIELVPDANYNSVEELLEENPQVIIKEAATEINYDFISEEFTDQNNKIDVKPYGTFTAKDGKLTGVSAILVPQTIAADKVFIQVRVGSKTYGFSFGEIHSLTTSSRETHTLTIRKNASLEGTIECTIEDWENDYSFTGDLTEIEDENNQGNITGYKVSLPDFSSSSVYKVVHNDKFLAEICREYLKGGNINNQAIVVYPVMEGEVNYTAGLVAQVLDGYDGSPLVGTVHGGSVSWNMASNTFVYAEGSSVALTEVYVKENEGVSITDSQSSSSSASTVADVIEDERNSQQYPIVKIGTQYWMQENLKATVLRGGEALINATEATKWTNLQGNGSPTTPAYCMDWQDKSIFYNYAAIQSAYLVPEGWSVPSSADWDELKTYTNDPTTLISLNWETGNNLSGFSVEGYGYRSKSGEYIKLQKAYFWANNQRRYEITETVNLVSLNTTTDGVNVRCIKK